MRITFRLMGIVAAWLTAATIATAQVPKMINYQGSVARTIGPFTGLGHFKFALVDATGANTYWSNDDTTGAGAVPTAKVPVQVNNGLFSVMLGGSMPGMTSQIDPTVFANSFVSLRVWFSTDGGTTFNQLTPDMRVTSAGYAMIAENVVNGAIDESKLADGAVNSLKLADNAVGAAKLASLAVDTPSLANGAVTAIKLAIDAVTTGAIKNGAVTTAKLDRDAVTEENLATDSVGSRVLKSGSVTGNELVPSNWLGDEDEAGKLKVWSGDGAANPGITLDGADRELTITDDDGDDAVSLRASDGGRLDLNQGDGRPGIDLDGNAYGSDRGGAISIYNGRNIAVRATVDSSNGGGVFSVNDTNGNARVLLDAYGNDSGGDITVRNDSGTETVVINGAEGSGEGGQILLYNGNHDKTVEIDGDSSSSGGGEISVRDASGHETVEILGAESGTDGGQMLLKNASQWKTIQIDGDASDSEGWIGLYRNNKTEAVIELDAHGENGDARIRTEVLEITGGSDLSEQFDVTVTSVEIEPGMILCIDPSRPGNLIPSSRAYDRTAAGVLSGAGGVKPGMLMGQVGSIANGKYPVALTGRVYCQADASNGAIQPGDLLTTSDLPGHAMKVTDHARAQGAIIGKAMTPVAGGRGLVLVLVTLQ